jgi:Flp pilus assembly protein TadB
VKKNLLFLIVFAMVSTLRVQADTGGAVAAGVAAGLFTGIATSAIANSGSSRHDRAEAQALKAREENEQMRRDNDRERVEQLRRESDRREAERKDEQIRQLNDHLRHIERQSGNGPSPLVMYLLFGFILMLTATVGVLGLILFRRR